MSNHGETEEARVQSVLERARTGDRSVLPELRRILDERPGIWRQYAALGSHARNAWIGLISGQDLALQESLDRQAEAMKHDLAGANPSPLETLLLDRIVACWLQMAHADFSAARAGEISLGQSNEIRKRQDSAHRRYITAVATLAMTRRLLGLVTSVSSRGSRTKSRTIGPIGVVGAETIEYGHEELGGHLLESDSSAGASSEIVLRHGPPSVSGPRGPERSAPRELASCRGKSYQARQEARSLAVWPDWSDFSSTCR